jgi:multidrug resistance efflux pump
MFKTKMDNYTAEVEQAREDVAKAMQDYSRGRVGVGKINEANDRLAQAHAEWRECYGLNVPDTRR